MPVFFVRVGTQAQFSGNVRQAIADGFDELVATIQPPLLPHVTNPLTLERGYKGKGMPIVTFDLVDGADNVDITCSPKALGSGRWAALEIFSFPDLATIEKFVLETVIRAGSQPCPPVVIGVGIGGTFDYAAKLAKEATLRPIGEAHAEPMVADMERAAPGGGQQDGLRPDGHRRRLDGDGGARELRRGSRLHAGGGVLQLLDQPAHARADLQRRARRDGRVSAVTIRTHRMRFPLSAADARALRAGDQVVIDGEIVMTAGLPTHPAAGAMPRRRRAAADGRCTACRCSTSAASAARRTAGSRCST